MADFCGKKRTFVRIMGMKGGAKNIKIYKASAGSGKTYRLAYEYVLLLFRNRTEAHPHRGTLAVTFTNKATDEMKRRIVQELHALATRNDAPFLADLAREPALNGLTHSDIRTLAQRFLTDILHDYSGFNVSTIDRFFQQIVRAFTREIGMHGNYGVELDTQSLLQQSIDNMLFELDLDKNSALLDWLKEFAEERIANDKSWQINSELERLGEEIFKEAYQQFASDTRLHDKAKLADYRKQLVAIVAAFEPKMRQLCAEAAKIMQRHGLKWYDFSGGITRSFAHYFDYKHLKNKGFDVSNTFRNVVGNGEKWSSQKSPKRTEITAAYNDGLNDVAAQMVSMIDGEECRRYLSAKIALENISLLGVLGDISAQIQRYCDEKNAMPISNTTDFLHKIIAGCDTPFVYEKAGVFLHHFMIDEFQDTSLQQWENFRPLLQNSVAENRQNLIVGDVKQSIYRWRNSDWRLLQNRVKADFGQNVEELQLDTNWRSARRVVQFNNALFAHAPQLIESYLGDDRTKMVQELYSGVTQQIKSSTDGYVQMQFLPAKKDDDSWCEKSLQQLPPIIENLKANGYRLSQMTVLVRRNVEATQVADFLLQAGYEVVSNEALLIASAPCVRFLTGMMRFFVEPANRINRLLVEAIYRKQRGEQPAISISNETAEEWLTRLFGDKVDEINTLKNKPLFQFVEAMIQLFALTEREGNRVFLQAFQDEIFAYTANYEADINGFLEHWDEVSGKRFLAASETQNAIRIMTVHKSKGLEFEAVIIPFCEWKFEEKQNSKKILWCKPDTKQEPFNKMPVVPIAYKKELARTIFAEAYREEQMYNCIDVLNTAYVAFTRPKKCLYIIAPQQKNDKNEIKSIANLLEHCFCHDPQMGDLADSLQKTENEEITTVEIGQCEPLKAAVQTPETSVESLPLTYDTVSAESRLRLRYMPDDDGSERQHGLLMHSILGRIARADELDKTLRQCINDGEITDAESAQIRKTLLRLLSKNEARDWFSGRYEVRNETEIIAASGKLYRPDRVMVDGRNVVVVDYKFGTQKQPRYRTQVANYMRLIEKMGYQAKGYIWYTMLDEIEEV